MRRKAIPLLLGALLALSLSLYVTPSVRGQTVVAIVPVGGYPLVVAVNSVTNEIYVPNFNGQTVSVINGATNAVVATISDVGLCGSLACRPQGPGRFVDQLTNRIYVSTGQGGSVIVIDGTTNTVMTNISLLYTPCSEPTAVAVNEEANRIYVACPGSSALVIIDGGTNTVMDTIHVSASLVAFNPSTNRIYVAGSQNVTAIDGTTNTVTANIMVTGTRALVGLDINPTTNRLYVSDFLSGGGASVSVIDGSTNTVIASIPVGPDTGGVGVDPATNKIYVAGGSGLNVLIIDGTTNAVVATVPASHTSGVAVNPVTNLIYVTQPPGNDVVVISGKRATSTIVGCSKAKGSIFCTATVTDTSPGTPVTPTGTVGWKTSGTGTFSLNPCTLLGSGSSATCTVNYRPVEGIDASIITITGNYNGDTDHSGSSGSTTIRSSS